MSELYELPSGWIIEKFDEIKISNTIGVVKNQQQQSIEHTYKYVKMNNITNDNGFSFNNIINVEATDEEADKFSLSKGDFLFNTRNSYELVGKTCIFDYDLNEIVLYNNNIMRVRFKDDISPYFIGYQFSSNFIQTQLNNIKSGTTNVSAIYYKTLKDIDVIIPPLVEQQRIVSKLDLVFEKIDKSIALHQKNMDEADVFMGSVLNDVFRELNTNETISLKDITTKIGSGSTPRGGQKAYKTEGISLIRSMNVHDNGFRIKGLAFIDDEQAKKLDNVTIEENDVLLNITGASVARCCIVDKNYIPARVNQHVSILRLKDEMIPSFLHYYLISPSVKSDLLFSSSGGATREAITKSMLEEFQVPVVSLSIQQKIVKYLDGISKKIEKVKSVQKDKMDSLKALKASILDSTFRGEL